MKKVYLNLKRFDVLPIYGGINHIGEKEDYARRIVSGIEDMGFSLPITIFFQESNLLSALASKKNVTIGCQGVHDEDVNPGGNFGAFTTFRTAKAMKGIGVEATIIGHCEERNYLRRLQADFGGKGNINAILNQEIRRAKEAGLKVLYCIGERAEERERKYDVLKEQIESGLAGVDLADIAIAYEPVWAIGPGKTPPGKEEIQDIARYVKSLVNVDVIYGGGLKKENAAMLASIPEVDGGLIALTRFGKDFGFALEDFEEIVKLYGGLL